MKRMILATATMFLLTAAAAMAQNPLNTTAPGPTQQRAPGQTNNDLPNPGHPVPTPQGTTAPVTENGTVTGTATESIQQEPTDTTTGTMDHGTGSMDNSTVGGSMESTDTTTGTPTSASTTTTATTTTSGTSDSLPATGSELPLVGLIGLSALAGAVALRASRN